MNKENGWNEYKARRYQEKLMELEKQLRQEIRRYRRARIYSPEQMEVLE